MGTAITEMNITNKHKKPFSQIVREVVAISDIILEILDARFITETRVPELEEEIKAAGKKIIYIINKADLADVDRLKSSETLRKLKPYVLVSSKERRGKAQLMKMIKIEIKRLNVPFPKKHVGIIGYPNTGKSSLINYLSGKGGAKTSAEANYTKGMQKIKLASDILLLDTPGIVPPKEDNLLQRSIVKKAELGIESYSQTKDPELAVSALLQNHQEEIDMYYKLNSEGDYEKLSEILGRRWHFLQKGNKVDIDKTLRRVLKDWQEGKIRS